MSSTRIHRASHKVHVPSVDLPTYIFSNSIKHRKEPQYFDADNPSVNFSLEQAQIWVKRWAKGIQDFGLEPNEKIMLFSGNSVYFPIMLWGVLASGCVFTGCSPGSSVDGMAPTQDEAE
jgi:acyl-CoA synthetase (AMP-forming)/AMP-acid ligase II